MMRWMVLGVAAMLASCGEPATNQATPAPRASPDPIEAAILALPEGQRRATIFRAIYDAGQPCQQITDMASRGRIDGHPVWVARCQDRAQYIVALAAGGTFQVTVVPAPKTT